MLGSAAAVALCSSVCSAIDAVGVRQAPAGPFTVLVLGLTGQFTVPAMLALPGRRRLAEVGPGNHEGILLVAVVMMTGFLLVMHAYAIAKISYVGALREVSVVFAALGGWLLRGESFGAVRVGGSLLSCRSQDLS